MARLLKINFFKKEISINNNIPLVKKEDFRGKRVEREDFSVQIMIDLSKKMDFTVEKIIDLPTKVINLVHKMKEENGGTNNQYYHHICLKMKHIPLKFLNFLINLMH